MILRERNDGTDQVRVTFLVPADMVDDQAVAVVGNFNGWDPAPLERRPTGLRSVATHGMPRITCRWR